MPEHAEILAGLYGLREAPPGVADVTAAFAIGLILAGIVGMAFSVFRIRPQYKTWADRVAAARTMPEAERPLHLALLLKEATDQAAPGPERWTERAAAHFHLDPVEIQAVSDGLYRPGPMATDLLDEALSRAVRKAGR